MSGLKEHVEGRIFKGYMIIGNLSEEEFKLIDDYCKKNYFNNRKNMLLDLLKYKEHDVPIKLLDDKLHLLYNEFDTRITAIEAYFRQQLKSEEPREKKKPTWKGFSG